MAYTRLRYHIITTTKFRTPWLRGDVESFAYAVLRRHAEQIGGKIMYIGGIEDHVHQISAVPPKLALSDFVGRIKSECTKAIHREFPALHDFGWGVSFGAFTLNPHDMSRVIHYVLNQKEHHQRRTLRDDWERDE